MESPIKINLTNNTKEAYRNGYNDALKALDKAAKLIKTNLDNLILDCSDLYDAEGYREEVGLWLEDCKNNILKEINEMKEETK